MRRVALEVPLTFLALGRHTQRDNPAAARVEALRGIDLCVKTGEFLAIMGASGSGKSTLLHLIGGLDPDYGGAIQILDQDLRSLSDDELTVLRCRKIGFVFQAFNLLPVLTAKENVSLPLVVDGMDEPSANEQAIAAMQRVGVASREAHFPPSMSGGEQQRVALARALVTKPALILADEPTGNLDSINAEQIIALLRTLVDEQHHTVLMVTHNPAHAAVADRLIVLRDGQIEQEQLLPRGKPANEVLRDLESAS